MIAFAAEWLMEMEVAATGVGYCEKRPLRLAQRKRSRDSRHVELRIPNIKKGSYPGFHRPRPHRELPPRKPVCISTRSGRRGVGGLSRSPSSSAPA